MPDIFEEHSDTFSFAVSQLFSSLFQHFVSPNVIITQIYFSSGSEMFYCNFTKFNPLYLSFVLDEGKTIIKAVFVLYYFNLIIY